MELQLPPRIFNNAPVSNIEKDDQASKKWEKIEHTITSYLRHGKRVNIVPLTSSLTFLLNRNMYTFLYQNVIKLFYKYYQQVNSQLQSSQNSLKALMNHFTNKQKDYQILFGVLNSYLRERGTQLNVLFEDECYKILTHQILNSDLNEQICAEILTLIQEYRRLPDSSMDQRDQILGCLSTIKKIGLFQCFEQQFLQKSKYYYLNLSAETPKNQLIFTTIKNHLSRQLQLNRLLSPSQSTVLYLQKQLIDQYFPYMIEFLDSLFLQQQFDTLKIVWNFTIRSGEKAMGLLEGRLGEIIYDMKKFIDGSEEGILKIVKTVEFMNGVVSKCFQSNKILSNLIYNTTQQLLVASEKTFNEQLCKSILVPCYSLDQTFKLFKLLPNKQKFMKQLQIRLSRFILGNQLESLAFQSQMVQFMKKQCGTTLCKKLERMINDVWRGDCMISYSGSQDHFKCRLLSSEWPKVAHKPFLLPEPLRTIQMQFEEKFTNQAQNNYKQIKWVNKLGIVFLAIHGITSKFSQMQAAVILLVERSIRPMKVDQFCESLQLEQKDIQDELRQLVEGQILIQNSNSSYQINDGNQKPYHFSFQQQTDVQEIQTQIKRDDSILIEACIMRTLKKKKAMQKTDLSKVVTEWLRSVKPTLQQINEALEKLANKDYITIDRNKGTLHYKQ